ncbi:hypothetical protein [Flavobacterium sp.]|jgi:hypothetical protein|uniref:hypothetical protein n=1 Tax=Flavobacterium sp. TaxID=239 RepID=UPI003D26733E
MKNIILLIVTILTIYSCATNTQKNDYKHYEFVLIKIPIDQKSSQMVNELRFTVDTKSGETQKFMQYKYGKQINEIPTNRALPMQIWTNVKLFNWTDELFTIGVCGDYIKKPTIEINGKQKYVIIEYNSVIVFDSKNEDCFKKTYKYRDSLTNYFISNTKK